MLLDEGASRDAHRRALRPESRAVAGRARRVRHVLRVPALHALGFRVPETAHQARDQAFPGRVELAAAPALALPPRVLVVSLPSSSVSVGSALPSLPLLPPPSQH